MRILLLLVRWWVGLLFIFSGLVKANDPLGLSYKMQEFFEVWNWHGLNDYTLAATFVLNSFEIVAGVALLTGFAFRYVGWMLLGLILLFTALTGYTFFTGMPKNCGCFGDCIPISAGFSFGKDILLILLIAVLLFFNKATKNTSYTLKRSIPVILATIFSIGLQWYALRYLPPVDCLPYKEGTNIPDGLKMPANAIADSFAIEFTYRKKGKNIRFSASEFPADFSSEYEFVKREDKLIRKGSNNEPPIKGFTLQGSSGIDSTQAILNTHRSIWVWAASVRSFGTFQKDLTELVKAARLRSIPVFFITAQTGEATDQLQHCGLGDVPVFSCDLKAIQTAARVDPTVMLVSKGTIQIKRSIPRWKSVIE
jgi:uncharacterized membrane protein YphA (DoxX/SURF4 family)